MQRQPSSSPPHTQSTSLHRAPLQPCPTSSSSLNVVANPLHKATFHRFRRPGYLVEPTAAPLKSRASDTLARPDSPPPSSSAPQPAPPQHVEHPRAKTDSANSLRKTTSSPSPNLDDLKPSAGVRSPRARRSAAVQTTPFPRLSTALLSPFQRHLGTDRDVYVELLSNGELVLDSRRRERKTGAAARDEVYLFSGNGEEMSIFHPSSTLGPSAPLVLVHPSSTHSYSDLVAVASASNANSAHRRHAKAYRTATRIITALKSRVTLMSFYHPAPPLALADRVKMTVYADLESFACSATVGHGQDRGLATALVHPSRDSLVLTLPRPLSRAPTSTATSSSTSRLFLPLSKLVSPDSADAPSNDALALIPPDLPPTARALVHCAAAPSTRTLVERVRAAHLAALATSCESAADERARRAPRTGPSGATQDGASLPAASSTSRSEERVVRELARTLGVAPPSPARARSAGVSARGEGRGAAASRPSQVRQGGGGEDDERCLPGLGWVLRERGGSSGERPGFGKAEEEDEAAWRVLFADGEELQMRLRRRRVESSAGDGGPGGTMSVNEGERDEVELRWRGDRYPLRRADLPTRLVRRLPLALELLALFLATPPSPPP
ncbi:uncharacterized protein RHOBADRAFT_46113 [Rhodotorula graminis WP1]|uniref:Uncharacterized protein n=1 Tax=Rhodotorula graminis (strain WP1) TaxID=578459 RepID=A0A0P9GJ63_RHOGW|nr:uncharacterized protein RHOBADRAFT_46113 [Rhodotorula graminis WP1]KPV73019.1 hypothetical protein RHOBADRAFT_46113 [Rhodotorula graminis WP1]